MKDFLSKIPPKTLLMDFITTTLTGASIGVISLCALRSWRSRSWGAISRVSHLRNKTLNGQVRLLMILFHKNTKFFLKVKCVKVITVIILSSYFVSKISQFPNLHLAKKVFCGQSLYIIKLHTLISGTVGGAGEWPHTCTLGTFV